MRAAFIISCDLEQQGQRLVEALGGRWSTRGGMCRCPAHADRTPSLSVRLGHSSLLVHCFSGCETSDVLRAIRAQHLLRGERLASAVCKDPPPALPDHSAAVRRLWAESHALGGCPSERYLAGRGLKSVSAALRFHPRTPLGSGAAVRFLPALIAAIKTDTGLVAVHRTFLTPEGSRAALDAPRRMLGRPGQGTVRLEAPGRVLGLAEGLETAIAAQMLHAVPVWAVLGNERFGMVALPPHVEQLILFVDNDAGGRLAETRARRAFDDRLNIVTRAPVGANDWNDVLLGERGEGAVAR